MLAFVVNKFSDCGHEYSQVFLDVSWGSFLKRQGYKRPKRKSKTKWTWDMDTLTICKKSKSNKPSSWIRNGGTSIRMHSEVGKVHSHQHYVP